LSCQGKWLDKTTYLAVQPIYYPGFTIGAGFGKGGGMVSMLNCS
jgi:hypothetical protein